MSKIRNDVSKLSLADNGVFIDKVIKGRLEMARLKMDLINLI